MDWGNKMFKYSVSQWIYNNEPLESSLKRLKEYGYDGIELVGEPTEVNLNETRNSLQDYGIECSSICGTYTFERDLSSDSPIIRQTAIDYVKSNVDFSAELNSEVLIVVPTFVGKVTPDSTYEKSWNNALESIKQIGDYAATTSVNIVIEPLNRYESFLVSNLSLAKNFVKSINNPSVGLMADLFHMNIEEHNNVESLLAVKEHLMHVHFADNTREGVGTGNINFTEVMHALISIGYQEYIAMEFIPGNTNPFIHAEHINQNETNNAFTKSSIKEIKSIESKLLL